MVDDTKIQQAFITKYNTLSPLPSTVFENKAYPDIKNGMFVAVRHFPSIPDYPELGTDAKAYVTGFFVTTIYDKEGNGWKSSNDLGTRIKTLFNRNVVFSYSDHTLKVLKSYKMQSDTENGVYQLPIMIQYEGWI